MSPTPCLAESRARGTAPAIFNLKRALLFRLSAVLLGAAALQAEQPQGQECRDLVEHGRRAYESRGFETAIGDFTSALAVCGQRSEIHLALGRAQVMAGRVRTRSV